MRKPKDLPPPKPKWRQMELRLNRPTCQPCGRLAPNPDPDWHKISGLRFPFKPGGEFMSWICPECWEEMEKK